MSWFTWFSREGRSIQLALQNCPYFDGQLSHGKWFLQKVVFHVHHFVIQDSLAGVTGNE